MAIAKKAQKVIDDVVDSIIPEQEFSPAKVESHKRQIGSAVSLVETNYEGRYSNVPTGYLASYLKKYAYEQEGRLRTELLSLGSDLEIIAFKGRR